MSFKVSNMGGMSWNMFIHIKDCAINNDGVVFGGAVRDLILHNTAAEAFYKKVADGLYSESDYTDVHKDKETLDRFILPQDVDVVFYSNQDVKKFKKALDKADLVVVNESHPACPKRYFSTFPEGWLHSKWTLRIKLPLMVRNYTRAFDIPTYEVDVIFPDPSTTVMVNTNMLPPFGVVDFECNALVIQKKRNAEDFDIDNKFLTYIGSSALNRQMTKQRIISDIINKQAKFVGTADMDYRIRKMLDKGFTVTSNLIKVSTEEMNSNKSSPHAPADIGSDNTMVEEDNDIESGDNLDLCLICFENVCGDYVSMPCCKGKYHPGCLKEVITNCDTCPQCRAEFYADSSDQHLLTALVGLFADPTAALKPRNM